MTREPLARRDRVRAHTAPRVNERIDLRTAARVQRVSADRDGIGRRLAELDREWDVDRATMAVFSIAGTVAHELSARRLTALRNLHRVQLAFLLVHAVWGWSPPAALLRRLGFRTTPEIGAERALLRERLEAAAV